jgi:hypothetical protein
MYAEIKDVYFFPFPCNVETEKIPWPLSSAKDVEILDAHNPNVRMADPPIRFLWKNQG